MATNLFRRYIWLIDTIHQSNRITFEEISAKWANSALNDENGEPLARRTFARHKVAIENELGVKIEFRKSDNTYSIANFDDFQSDDRSQWIINSFSTINMLQESYQFKDRILFEKVPSGTEYLVPLINAIKENRIIHFLYDKFGDMTKEVDGAPYCLKIDKQRWYVLLQIEGRGVHTYALDRISELIVTDDTFKMPSDFSAKDYFADSYGIWVNEKKPAETVRIMAFENQVNYLRTLPLHHSQHERVLNKNTSIFEYHLKIDVEFTSELFKLGDRIEVLEPESIRDDIRERLKKMINLYGL